MDFIDKRIGTGRCVVGGPEPKRRRGGVRGAEKLQKDIITLSILRGKLIKNPEENQRKIALIDKYSKQETRKEMTNEEIGQIVRMKHMVREMDREQAMTTPPRAERPVEESLGEAWQDTSPMDKETKDQLGRLYFEPESEEAKEAAKEYEEQKLVRAPVQSRRVSPPIIQAGPTCVHASLLQLMVLKPELQHYLSKAGVLNLNKYANVVLPLGPNYEGSVPMINPETLKEDDKVTFKGFNDDNTNDYYFDEYTEFGRQVGLAEFESLGSSTVQELYDSMFSWRENRKRALNYLLDLTKNAQQGIISLRYETGSGHAIPFVKTEDGLLLPETNDLNVYEILLDMSRQRVDMVKEPGTDKPKFGRFNFVSVKELRLVEKPNLERKLSIDNPSLLEGAEMYKNMTNAIIKGKRLFTDEPPTETESAEPQPPAD